MDEISPLFAVDAEHLLRNGFYEDAIELCEEGLKEYPDYPAAIAILAKAYKCIGDSGMAHNLLDNAAKSFPAFRTIKNAQENIDKPIENMVLASSEVIEEEVIEEEVIEEEIINYELEEFDSFEEDISEINNYSEDNQQTFNYVSDNLPTEEQVSDELTDDIETINEDEISENNPNVKYSTFDYDFELSTELMQISKINSAIPELIPGIVELIPDYFVQQKRKQQSISLFDVENSLKSYRENPLTIFTEIDFAYNGKNQIKDYAHIEKTMYDDDYEEYAKPTVITETIANILYQQGAIDEAIEAYQQLAETILEKKEYFLNKIEEIKSNNFGLSINNKN